MASNKEGKPGIMIYFDLLSPLSLLSYEEKGILLQTMLVYGKTGEEPKIERSDLLEMAWCIIRQRLDLDDETYHKKVARRKYAAYVRWCKKKGNTVLDYDDWVSSGGLEDDNTYLDPNDALA